MERNIVSTELAPSKIDAHIGGTSSPAEASPDALENANSVADVTTAVSRVESRKESLFDAVNDDVLFRIFRAVVGQPAHVRYEGVGGVVREVYDNYFGDRHGIYPTQNAEYPMVFVLPLVCRRWRDVMRNYPAIYSRASIVVRESSQMVPLPWWRSHALRLETLYLEGNHVEHLGDVTAVNIGILSLLSTQNLKALCLGDCFENGATRPVMKMIQYLTNLVQLQVYRAAQSFVENISSLTRLRQLKILELGYAQNTVCPFVELSTSSFPISLERLALCEALVSMNVQTGDFLTNLKDLKLMSCTVAGEFCEHLGNLPHLTKLVVDESVLEGEANSNAINTDFLPDDLRRLSALENIHELFIQGSEGGPRGYFEWLGEELLREPPFMELESLSLCFASLGVMSEAFDVYQNLTFLYIVQIRFETIPDPVLRLPNLVHLEMISCDICSFPDTAPCCAEKISTLNLCGNRLRVIPKGLATWKNLQILEFTENPILDFANIECLLKLQKLKSVCLLDGMKVLDHSTLDYFCQEFAHMTAALKLGFVCAMLACKDPPCRLFL